MSWIQDLGLLVLRLAFGAYMIVGHGWGKFQRLLSGEEIRFGDPIGLGVELSFYLVTFAEFACSILIAVGLFTRLAAIPAAFGIAVAAFVAHAGEPFRERETPLMYLAAWIAIFFTGPGRFSLSYVLNRGRDPQSFVGFMTR